MLPGPRSPFFSSVNRPACLLAALARHGAQEIVNSQRPKAGKGMVFVQRVLRVGTVPLRLTFVAAVLWTRFGRVTMTKRLLTRPLHSHKDPVCVGGGACVVIDVCCCSNQRLVLSRIASKNKKKEEAVEPPADARDDTTGKEPL